MWPRKYDLFLLKFGSCQIVLNQISGESSNIKIEDRTSGLSVHGNPDLYLNKNTTTEVVAMQIPKGAYIFKPVSCK